MKKGVLTFNPDGHKYQLDGAFIPSVTTILGSLNITDWSKVPTETLEASRIVGKNVHRICELYDNDRLDVDSLDEGGKAYLDGWIGFKKDFGIDKFFLSETPLCSQKYGFAGTPDRFHLLKGRMGTKRSIIDIKTGAPSKETPLQLSAYAQMWRELERLPISSKIRRIEVRLIPGAYVVKEHSGLTDWSLFLSALNIYNFKRKD